MRRFAILLACLLGIASKSFTAEVEWTEHMELLFEQAPKVIPSVRDFRSTFSQATIESFENLGGAHVALRAGLYGRYLVSLEVPVTLRRNGKPIKSWGEPKIEIYESGKITVAADDQGYQMDWISERKLSAKQFQTLKEHHGDFSAIGIELIRDQPVKDFDRVWMPASVKYVLRPSTFSPKKRYGVQLVVDHDEDWGIDRQNRVVEVRTGRVVTTIHADPGYNHRMNFLEVVPPRWSPDENLLLWEVAGKWCPTALVILKLEKGREAWQINLLTSGQQALLHRTKAAAPKKYLAAMKANAGNGSAFPDGFTVDVTADGEGQKTVALPLQVQVDLDANPKAIEDFPANLRSWLDGEVTKNGEFVVKQFHLGARPAAASSRGR